MQDNQENAVDQFIRKATEQYQVPFEEGHWKALETQLNVELPVVSPAGALPYTLTNAVSMLVGGFLIWIGGQELVYSKYEHVAPNQELVEVQNSAVIPDFQEAINHIDIMHSDLASEDQKPEQTSISGVPPAATSLVQPTVDGSHSRLSGSALQSMEEESQEYFEMTRLDRKLFTVQNEPEVHTPEAMWFLIEDTQAAPVLKPRKQLNDAFYFGTVIAPELNGVGLASQKKLSGQVGVSVQYELNRWIISTGLLYNKKKYIAAGEEFSPPPGYWGSATNGVVPSEIDGWCNVIDVPILLGFNLTPLKRWSLIPQAGISSYWLTKESCAYSFDDSYYGDAYGWSSTENSRLLFAVANLSIAARISLGNRTTVQVEPYMKIPLGEVGWGKVDLYSTGTLITLSYILAPNDF